VHAVSDSEEERRQNHALRRRIDQLIGRVRAAEDEIVERGLDAVQETKQADADAPPPPRRRARPSADQGSA
jgi:hypothetical protein